MPRRYSALVVTTLISLILASCGGSENDTLARNCLVDRTPVERFSLCLPDGWGERTESFGDGGSFVVFVQDASATGSVLQIHVKKDPLQSPVRSSMAFAERAVEIARQTAPNYKIVSTDPITINRSETLLHIFDASPDASTDPVRYYQFVTMHEGIAYGFTAIMLPNINDEQRKLLLDILTNLQFQ